MASNDGSAEPQRTNKASDEQPQLHPDVDSQRYTDTWTVLLALRAVNAVTLSTFFQPDEFYQALEPAWELAFGPASGAWITWEWKYQLRSSVQPVLIAGIYSIVARVVDYIGFPPTLRAQLLLLMPKAFQAGIAALQDYCTWRLAERIYGRQSYESYAVLGLTALSPWQWFVATRPLSNGLEAALTAAALTYWPWNWLMAPVGAPAREKDKSKLKFCFFLAGLACVLRPTNLLIWIVLSVVTLSCATQEEALELIVGGSIQGTAVLGISQGIDRWYYGMWTFPAARWLTFNLSQNLAIFYGENRSDYYFTEGLPILLTTALPFALVAIAKGMLGLNAQLAPGSSRRNVRTALRSLSLAALATPVVLTFISHKEVRFLYPLLPILLTLAAGPFVSFFHPFPNPASHFKKIILILIVLTNVIIGVYVGLMHNRGVMDITNYLRTEYVLQNPELATGKAQMFELEKLHPLTVGFLMPCHSTPWRSHLVYPGIDAWALTCEPPIGMNISERTSYLDEADQFYEAPKRWLSAHMESSINPSLPEKTVTKSKDAKRAWPQYLVFFQQLEPVMKEVLRGSKYEECWRGFNTHWHDDWRRQGDIVVHCADLGLKKDVAKDKRDYRGRTIPEGWHNEL